MEGIDFPTSISQINKIERQNNIALNVYGYERAVVPYHISGQPTEMPRINLLLLHDKQDNYHYCWIKHLSRLLFDQNKHKGKTYFCDRCPLENRILLMKLGLGMRAVLHHNIIAFEQTNL